MKEYKKENCIVLLKQKHEYLQAQGISRYPKRSDFSDGEVMAIKAFYGPWPRALEAAGIKPLREGIGIERNRKKRILAKRRRTAALKIEKQKIIRKISDDSSGCGKINN